MAVLAETEGDRPSWLRQRGIGVAEKGRLCVAEAAESWLRRLSLAASAIGELSTSGESWPASHSHEPLRPKVTSPPIPCPAIPMLSNAHYSLVCSLLTLENPCIPPL